MSAPSPGEVTCGLPAWAEAELVEALQRGADADEMVALTEQLCLRAGLPWLPVGPLGDPPPLGPLPEDYYADSGARREGCRVAVTVPAAPGERWQVDVHAPRRYGGRRLAGYLLDSAAEALWVAGREAQGEDAGPLAMARFRRAQQALSDVAAQPPAVSEQGPSGGTGCGSPPSQGPTHG